MNGIFEPKLLWEIYVDVSDVKAAIFDSAPRLVLLFAIAATAYFVARTIIEVLSTRLVRHSRTDFDDLLVEKHVFRRVAQLVPLVVLYVAARANPDLDGMLRTIADLGLVVVGVFFANAVFATLATVYERRTKSGAVPVKGIVQAATLVAWFIGAIFLLSVITGKSPNFFLGSLGAVTAILLLIFRDSILGFVAGVQIAANRLVSRGDWIEMPQFGADGSVIDVSLATVKVRNWDMTITSIPTYSLVSESFKNWRGMSESGGRRIKRSIALDVNSVRFVDEELEATLSKIELLRTHLESKRDEIKKHNEERGVDRKSIVNGRHLTNLGCFRAYVEAYLHAHSDIAKNMTFLVRQLAPSSEGVPIEVYVFSRVQQWVQYESIQADIFDHLIAVLPEFDLRLHQTPTGLDWREGSQR